MDALDPQLANRRAISGQPIKLVFQIVDASISFPADVFDERMERGGDRGNHLSFALPTFRARRSMMPVIFLIKPSSLGVGVRAATAEATAITAVMIWKIPSLCSEMYSIMSLSESPAKQLPVRVCVRKVPSSSCVLVGEGQLRVIDEGDLCRVSIKREPS